MLAKTYYAEKAGIDPKKIFMVAVMPCVAKKYEARRPEHFTSDGIPYTDAVLTTRELIWMIKCYGIDFKRLPPGEFDAWVARDPLKLYAGRLRERGVVTDADIAEMTRAIAAEIDDAVVFAKASPFPTRDQLTAHLYAP